MNLLLETLWPGLAAALALGLAVGALAGLPRGRWTLAGAGALALVLAALAGLAGFGVVAGRSGLRVEIAASILAAYLAGCGIGGLGRRLAGRAS